MLKSSFSILKQYRQKPYCQWRHAWRAIVCIGPLLRSFMTSVSKLNTIAYGLAILGISNEALAHADRDKNIRCRSGRARPSAYNRICSAIRQPVASNARGGLAGGRGGVMLSNRVITYIEEHLQYNYENEITWSRPLLKSHSLISTYNLRE